MIRRARCALVLGGLAALSAVLACSVSSDEERELGVQLAASTDSQLPLIHDTAVTEFVTRLGKSMASRTRRADLEWRFAVVNTDQVNAFALPGGFIYVTRGAIELSDRLDELAGVVGHEIGHVVRRHSVKQLQQAEKRDVGVVLLCTLTRVCRHIGGIIAIQTATDAMTAQYSQRDEAEADSEAVINTLRAGIDPEGLPVFLQKVLAQRKAEPTPVDAFFSTHPTDESRIAALTRQLAASGSAHKEPLTRDSPEFHAIQTRLRALPPPPHDTVIAQRPQ